VTIVFNFNIPFVITKIPTISLQLLQLSLGLTRRVAHTLGVGDAPPYLRRNSITLEIFEKVTSI